MTDLVPASISFPPIAGKDAQILILGSMPGIKSLQEQQYYAHPRNAFWPIMASLYDFDLSLDYAARCQQLVDNKVAIWDVLKSCCRQGSLDQAIETDSIVANDFLAFLTQYPKIKSICFNGTKAEQVFHRYVLPTLTTAQQQIIRHKLPSTSPAHATQSFDDKLSQWQITKQNMEAD
ncbi:MAG: DNA-deoxyinosine glycosylase [Piscirickettsiaceae bacterium]|nr:DNA-deoxyinosine glycosylase [Piscirickettsiaceae bacterium]